MIKVLIGALIEKVGKGSRRRRGASLALELLDDSDYEHGLTLARVAFNLQELSIVGLPPLTEIVAVKDLVRGATKEAPFRVGDTFYIVPRVGQPEVREALFRLLILLPRFLLLICLLDRSTDIL